MQKRFLYICRSIESPWREVLAAALNSLGILDIATKDTYLVQLDQKKFELVILDFETELDFKIIKKHLRSINPNTKLVATFSLPITKNVTRALLNGADDFITRSEDSEFLQKSLNSILSR